MPVNCPKEMDGQTCARKSPKGNGQTDASESPQGNGQADRHTDAFKIAPKETDRQMPVKVHKVIDRRIDRCLQICFQGDG